MKYIALLRGINVGGNKKVPMAILRETLEALGYQNVKTLLNSGNVVFESDEKTIDVLAKTIEKKLEEVFNVHIPTILRTYDNIQKLIESDPFKNILVTPQTRLYITFLASKPSSNLPIPYKSPEKDFIILQVTDTEIISVLTLSEKRGTVDAMSILEKEFGKQITTRNWNTVVKISKL